MRWHPHSFVRALRHQRKGSTLIELLVAMPLMALAAAAATLILVRVARTSRVQAAMLSNASGLRQAGLVLAADLAPLAGRDLITVTDTLLEFNSHLGLLLACKSTGPNEIVVASPAGASDNWVRNIRAGDEIQSWISSRAPTAIPPLVTRRVVGAAEGLAHSACGMGSTPQPRWRIPVADSMVAPIIGSPLLVQRAVRYQHYRSGASWWLGRRSRDGAVWEGLQPVVGPLSSPVSGGVVVQAQAADGRRLVLPSPVPDSVAANVFGLVVTVRMPRPAGEYNSGRPDSATILIPLRAAAAGARP